MGQLAKEQAYHFTLQTQSPRIADLVRESMQQKATLRRDASDIRRTMDEMHYLFEPFVDMLHSPFNTTSAAREVVASKMRGAGFKLPRQEVLVGNETTGVLPLAARLFSGDAARAIQEITDDRTSKLEVRRKGDGKFSVSAHIGSVSIFYIGDTDDPKRIDVNGGGNRELQQQLIQELNHPSEFYTETMLFAFEQIATEFEAMNGLSRHVRIHLATIDFTNQPEVNFDVDIMQSSGQINREKISYAVLGGLRRDRE